MIAVFALAFCSVPGAVELPAVQGVDGRMHQPLVEAHGKPVALLFISHDCPVCNTYAPEIGRIEARYGSRVDIDIVYSEPNITRALARAHAKDYSIGHANLMVDAGSRFAAACGAQVTPQAIVYDSMGHSVYSGRIDDWYLSLGHQRPAVTTHDLSLALEAVLANQKPKPAAGPPVGCFIILPLKT
jgi:hypothetical protein